MNSSYLSVVVGAGQVLQALVRSAYFIYTKCVRVNNEYAKFSEIITCREGDRSSIP